MQARKRAVVVGTVEVTNAKCKKKKRIDG